MPGSAERSPFSDLRNGLFALGGELKEIASLHWQLARLELQTDLRSVTRLAIVWVVAAIMLSTALPLAVACLAVVLDGSGGIPTAGWLLIFAAGLVFTALTAGYLAWRRFCRRLVGLRETLEELREDLLWLRERR